MVTFKAYPSLDASKDTNSQAIDFSVDYSYFKYLDPFITQKTNIFFMKSSIRLIQSIFDIFESSEKEQQLFELNDQQEFF